MIESVNCFSCQLASLKDSVERLWKRFLKVRVWISAFPFICIFCWKFVKHFLNRIKKFHCAECVQPITVTSFIKFWAISRFAYSNQIYYPPNWGLNLFDWGSFRRCNDILLHFLTILEKPNLENRISQKNTHWNLFTDYSIRNWPRFEEIWWNRL